MGSHRVRQDWSNLAAAAADSSLVTRKHSIHFERPERVLILAAKDLWALLKLFPCVLSGEYRSFWNASQAQMGLRMESVCYSLLGSLQNTQTPLALPKTHLTNQGTWNSSLVFFFFLHAVNSLFIFIYFFKINLFFSSTSFLVPTHLPPPSCTHAQSCNPMDFSPPDSSVHGFFQAKILECVAISFSILTVLRSPAWR